MHLSGSGSFCSSLAVGCTFELNSILIKLIQAWSLRMLGIFLTRDKPKIVTSR